MGVHLPRNLSPFRLLGSLDDCPDFERKTLEKTKESNQITANPPLLVLIRMTWGILSWNNQRIFWADGLEARKAISSKGYHRYLKWSFGWVMKVVRCRRFRTPCWNSLWRMSYVLSILVNGLFTHFWMRVVIISYTRNPKQTALNGCLAIRNNLSSHDLASWNQLHK